MCIYINICIYIQERRAGQLELQHKKEKKKASRETPQEKYLREDLISLLASQSKTHNRLHQALLPPWLTAFISHSYLLPNSNRFLFLCFFQLLFQLGRLHFIFDFAVPLLFFLPYPELSFGFSLGTVACFKLLIRIAVSLRVLLTCQTRQCRPHSKTVRKLATLGFNLEPNSLRFVFQQHSGIFLLYE